MTDTECNEMERNVPDQGWGAGPRWSRAFVATAALVIAVLLGGAGGLFLAGSTGDPRSAPTAVDVGFAQDMAAHHRQGVEMARVALRGSSDPEIRQIAFDIAATQTEQMGRMRGWLALWSKPMRPTGDRMSWMSSSGADSMRAVTANATSMPGMADSTELDRLRSLSGTKLDTYFLQLMIRHHQGGGPMMRAAIERARVGAVRNLAEQMLTAQTAEATTMTRMLTERGAAPLPEPSR